MVIFLLFSDSMEKILWVKTLAETKKFRIEGVDIDFGNGKYHQFERVQFQWSGKGIMVIPLERGSEQDGSDTYVYMIEHFMVGTERHELVLPWGHREAGMTLGQVVNQELQEEIWLLAKDITPLIQITSPGYMSGTTTFCLAEWLSPSSIQGDEYEDIVVHKISYQDALAKIQDWSLNDVRTVASILYLRNILF